MLKYILKTLHSSAIQKTAGLCLLGIATFTSSHAQKVRANPIDNNLLRRDTLLKPTFTTVLPTLYSPTATSLNTGAIGYLNGKVLESTPSSYIYQGLTGRIAGLRTLQGSGIPGSDDLSLILRGKTPTVYVDGVPRDVSELNPEQISSVSVLKDAISNVMLGQNGMNGAVLVETKRGDKSRGDYAHFNVKAQTALQTPVVLRKYLNAGDYATLFNEALRNDGNPALYSQEAINAYKNGTNPYLYPNVDWQNQLFKKNAGFTRYTVNADGSHKSINYFVSLDYLDQGGLFKELDSNAYSTNSNYKRYILRSNVNLQLSKTLEGYLNLYGRINTSNAPSGGSVSTIYSELNLTPNNAYPVYNPNGTLGGNSNYLSNLWGRSVYSGYTQNLSREAFFDFGLKQNLDVITKGMWASGKISFSAFSNLTTTRNKSFDVSNYSVDANGNPIYTKLANKSTAQTNSSSVTISEQRTYAEFNLGYNKQIGKNGIKALATANTDTYRLFTSSNLPRTLTNFAASVKYNWDEKYLVEGAASYSGLNYYSKGNQYGLFSAIGLGWNIHKENFMKDISFINELKIRGSYGLTGGYNQGNFNFQNRYLSSNGYYFGATAGGVGGLTIGTIPYDNTWSASLKSNIGFDASLLKNKFWLSFDYYNNRQTKLPIYLDNGNNTSLLGTPYPILYAGKSTISGIEVDAGWTDKIGSKFEYSISGNISTTQEKTTYNGEPTMQYPWMQRQGQYNNQLYGYIADGFVTTAGQGPVVAGYTSVPGDLKYKDLNGDNQIDYRDVTAIGAAKPLINYGLNLRLKYENFYISLLVQGVKNAQTMLTGNSYFPFLNTGIGAYTQAFPESMNRWTPETAGSASFPRLTVGGNVNNYVASSFWIRNTDFLRLKNTEIGYNFNNKYLNKLGITNIRVFANGLNLLTFSKFKTFDPEMPFADYSIQRVINGGLSITF